MMGSDWPVTNMDKSTRILFYGNEEGSASPWEDDWQRDTVQYLKGWLGWHNASMNEMRW
jgi:hypothetical protein